MKLQHIISTMHRSDFSVLQPMNCRCDMLVVNQCDVEKTERCAINECVAEMIYTTQRGLSNSRNMLLENATGDIVIVGDDDLTYVDGYEKIIKQAYDEHPEADIIVFNFTDRKNNNPRKYSAKPKRISIFEISKVASVEVTMRLNKVKEKGLYFDSLLGLGSVFCAGEENAFLADCLRAKLKIVYVPQVICYSPPATENNKKWKTGFDKDYFIKRGACFYRIYKIAFLFFTLAFVLLKKRTVFKNVPFFKAIGWMCEGKREYKKAAKE